MPRSRFGKRAQTDPIVYDDGCATRWPLLLVHGVGYKQAERFGYWGDIPQLLRAHGAVVYVSDNDAWGTTTSNAAQLETIVQRILVEQQVPCVNIIAHSKGGLDARELVARPAMRGKIASITTLSTPHHGVRSLNWINYAPRLARRILATLSDLTLILWGDDNPSFIQVCQDLSAPAMQQFNQRLPLPADIYFQSFTSIQGHWYEDLFFGLTQPLINWVEGPNDGLVAEASAHFGEYRGVVSSNGDRGYSHRTIVDNHLLVGGLQLLADHSQRQTIAVSPTGDRQTLASKENTAEAERRGRSAERAAALADQSMSLATWWLTLVADLKQRGY